MPKGVYKHKLASEETKRRMSITGKKNHHGKWNIGKVRSEDFKLKISQTTKGKSNAGAFKRGQISFNKGKKCPWAKNNPQIFQSGRLPWNTGKKRPEMSGAKSHLWKGGITPLNHQIRTSLEYKLWRESVFKRDNYTCQQCGDNKGGNLNAHHLKSFSLFPELRLAIDNGVTLCKMCHKKTDNWGRRLDKLVAKEVAKTA